MYKLLGPYGVPRQCLLLEEAFKILKYFHEGQVGGHFGMSTTIKKIL
jgi:hypothetical protein